MSTRSITGALIAVSLAVSCAAASWTSLDAEDLAGSRRAQYDAALAARDAMFGELMTTLAAELETGGPADAIAVCRDQAPAIAAATAERLGVRIGRTSWKLRNPANRPPRWAEPLLAERPRDMRVVASADGRLGLIAPIRAAGRCLTCHGPADEIPADVREALASLYPDDRATGFREGDLRGWFWVEVPSPSH